LPKNDWFGCGFLSGTCRINIKDVINKEVIYKHGFILILAAAKRGLLVATQPVSVNKEGI